MSAFSYITRASSSENRHIHISLAEASILLGFLVGNLVNGPIIDNLGLDVMVYTTVGTSLSVVIVVCVFLVDIRNEDGEFSWKETLKMKYIFAAVKCVFKAREGHSRIILQLCFLAYSLAYVCALGFNVLGYLYFVKEVGMTLTYFSLFTSTVHALKAVAGPLILLLAKKLRLNQMTIGQFASVVLVVGYTILSLGTQLQLMWIGGMLLSVDLILFAVVRNLQTKIVERDELGKLFSYDAVVLAITNSAIVLSFDYIYSWSLTFWPQMFLAVAAFACVCSLITLSVIILLIQRSNSNLNSSPTA